MAARMLASKNLRFLSQTGRKTLDLLYKNSSRRLCTSKPNGTAFTGDIPLNKSLPGLPKVRYALINNDTYETSVTTMENGLRVASENKFGEFCTVGVAIDSGARYEASFPSGIQHFLEKLAFSSTEKYENRDIILQLLEKHGGICDCQGSRDTLIYAVSAERQGLESMIELLAEVTLKPRITEHEIEDSGTAIRYELESLLMRPDPEPLVMEMIHAAAYHNNTLGLPKICPEDSIPLINRETLLTYLNHYHQPERMVLSGVGVEHDDLVRFAEQYFVKAKPTWEKDENLINKDLVMDKSISQYTGGLYKQEKDLSNVSLGPSPMPELAHLVLGLESCSHKDDDFIAFCVLNMMMGGGGSFSAGGPGKGMFTRLYLNVLNRHHWMFNATAFNHAYNDSGLFCIHASGHPSMLKDLTKIILQEMFATAGQVTHSELNRAKTQLQSMLLMNLEARPVVFEDIARQVLASGFRRSPQWYYDEIGKVTDEDIHRVATRMLKSKPAVAALGTLSHLPNYETISQGLTSGVGKASRKFSLFGRS